ncbi:MAG: phage tail protein [Pseudomonadota bacterium]|jgi:microcystin-dependent protein
MTFWKWSRTAANNANADPSCPFPEGMAPSAVNDGARAMMAAAAKYRDDIAGANLTTGTATAYALASYQGFDTLAHLDGQQIAFVPHVTNTGACTLNVDGLGAVPIRINHLTDLPSGSLIQGTPYTATYFNATNECILHLIGGNPYNVPLGGLLPYIIGTPPNSAFVFPYGQELSRTIYGSLFASIGTAYGGGDGSTTFNIPDLRGFVIAGLDGVYGTTPKGRITVAGSGVNGASIGATGGLEARNLTQANLPNVSPSFQGFQTGVSVTSNYSNVVTGSGVIDFAGSGGNGRGMILSNTIGSGPLPSSGTFTPQGSVGSINGGQQAPLAMLQPTIVLPYLLRVI